MSNSSNTSSGVNVSQPVEHRRSVVVFGDFPQGLSTLRSLSRAGYHCIAATSSTRSITTVTRHTHEHWHLPAMDHPDWPDALHARLRHRRDVVALYPIGVDTCLKVTPLAERWELPCVSAQAQHLAACNDKILANKLACEAGINVPTTRLVRNFGELVAACEEIGYPTIVKTISSEAPVCGHKALLLDDADSFKHFFPAWPHEHQALMVQAYIEGPVVACDFLADRGRVLCSYHSSGLDTDCPDGTGMVVLFRSEPANSALETALADFVRATHYTGPGLLQCVRCERSNQLYFIEVNPRLSAGIEESVQSGLDMPLLNLQIALDQADNVSPAYQPGRVSYWMERDLQGWLRQRGQMNLRQHVRKLGQVIGRLSKCHGHINWQISDPLPACLAMLRMLRSGFHASRSDTTQKTAPDTTQQAVTRVAGSAPPTHYPLKDVHPN